MLNQDLRNKAHFLHRLGPTTLIMFLSDLSSMLDDAGRYELEILLTAYQACSAGQIRGR